MLTLACCGVEVHEGYQADWLTNATGSKYIAFAAASQVLKANSSDLYPSAPPRALPDGSFALSFDYPVEGISVGDQLAVCPFLTGWHLHPASSPIRVSTVPT